MTWTLQPEPWGRTIAALLAAVGAVVTRDTLSLSFLWLLCAVILWLQGEMQACIKFLLHLWIPLTAGLIVVCGLAVRGTPDIPPGTDMLAGFRYAGLISLRLAALAALFQAAFLTLRGLRLAYHCSHLGLPPSAVAGLVSIFQLWPDFHRRTDQVVAARCARGLMTDRRFITRVKQLPFAFRTLFLSTLGSSLDRASRWQAEHLPERLVAAARSREKRGSPLASLFWFLLSLGWCLFALRPHLAFLFR
jgi:energy-coupling factor transporter transmembrane protein EcfT